MKLTRSHSMFLFIIIYHLRCKRAYFPDACQILAEMHSGNGCCPVSNGDRKEVERRASMNKFYCESEHDLEKNESNPI